MIYKYENEGLKTKKKTRKYQKYEKGPTQDELSTACAGREYMHSR